MTPPTKASDDRGSNPFDEFNDAVAGDVRDPYPEFAKKRLEEPVWTGSSMNPELLPPGIEFDDEWMVFRYDDCSRVLRDPKTFTSTGYDATIGVVMGHMILGMDDPEHRQKRDLVAEALREKSLARWEPELIGPIVDEMIDRFIGRGRAGPSSASRRWSPARATAGLPVRPTARGGGRNQLLTIAMATPEVAGVVN